MSPEKRRAIINEAFDNLKSELRSDMEKLNRDITDVVMVGITKIHSSNPDVYSEQLSAFIDAMPYQIVFDAIAAAVKDTPVGPTGIHISVQAFKDSLSAAVSASSEMGDRETKP